VSGRWAFLGLNGALLTGALLVAPVSAPAADLGILTAARWGMDADELDRALGSADSRLPGRWDFGRYYADMSVEDVEVAGLPFRAFLQMDRKSGKLAQILLERRGRQATPMVFEDIANALIGQFGQPDEDRRDDNAAVPASVRLVWRLPDMTINASFFDFRTSAIFSEDPNVEPNPLVPFSERQRNNPRTLPRRALIRFNPPGCDGAGC
jgi:hypothetical protein